MVLKAEQALTPISVTGNPTTDRRGMRKRVGGFTLIELVAVALIIGIVISTAILSVSVGERSRAKEFGQKFISVMNALSNEAILNGRAYGLYWDKTGRTHTVVCLHEDQGNWVVLGGCPGNENDKFLMRLLGGGSTARQLPPHWGMTFSADAESAPSISFGDVPAVEDEDTAIVVETVDDGEDGEKRKELNPWVSFEPTGLWQPDGVMQILVNRQHQMAFRWTATGRVNIVPAKPEDGS